MAFLQKKDLQTLPPAGGVPGARPAVNLSEDVSAALLTKPQAQRVIGEKEIAKAVAILTRYKAGKANLESRVVEDELWWEVRHWEVLRRSSSNVSMVTDALGNQGIASTATPRPEPSSAWLFNAIMNKHADAMDNYPEPNVLPRERGDEQDAKTLSSILPVILEHNEYEQTYSDNWWEKLKHGTAAYGVFWNKEKENGLGDVDIRSIDLLKLFWEPGVTDIQKSRNLFIVDMVDEDLLEAMYPQYKGKLSGSTIDVKQYVYDDTVDVTGKSVVVDWYYKKRAANGRTLLHYVKFVGSTLLFASENDPAYTENGWYDHGMYPVLLDTLFPEKGTPVGFGYVAICKAPQMYIDKLGQNILENSIMATKPRFFAGGNTGINEDEFKDWSKPIVHVEGSIDDTRLKQIVVSPLDDIYVSIAQLKIDELKETAANRDATSGGATSGVTAAAAIAALQEAGNKSSRDTISAAYRTHVKINYLCIELVRQFYDETRSFRITGQTPGSYDFVDYNNAGIKDQEMPSAYPGQDPMFRRPVFDITVKAAKKNPFSRMSQNELAKELYGMGFFNPERAQEALGALELMEFEGKDKVIEQVHQGQTLLNIVQQMSMQMDQMAAIIQANTGKDMGIGVQPGAAGTATSPSPKVTSGGLASDAAEAQKTNMTAYGDRLAKRSTPNMNATSNKAAPQ